MPYTPRTLRNEDDTPSGGRSVMGFLGNVAGDVGEIAQGLGSLLGTAAHDIGSGITEAATLGRAETDYDTDDIIKALPGVIAQDYSARYGGKGLDEVGHQLYENPLSYIEDLLTLATAGGYGAAKGASAASKVGRVSRGLDALADTGEAGLAARAVDKILPGIVQGRRAGDDLHPLAGTKDVIDPTGRHVVAQEREFNPARRFLRENVYERATTEPVDEQIANRLASIDESTTPGGAEAKLLRDTLRLAQANNITRVTRPRIARWQTRKLTSKLIGEHGARHIAERDERTARYEEIFSRLPREEADTFHRRLQGLDEVQGPPRLSYEQIVAAIEDPEISSTPKGKRIAEVVTTHRSAIEQIADPVEQEAARRLLEQVAGEPLATLRTGAGDEIADAVDETRLVNFAQEGSSRLTRGGTYRELFERALKPMHYMRTRKWDFESPEEAFALDDELRAAGIKAPVYFPHLDALRLSKSDFLMPWRTFRMRMPLKGDKHSSGAVFRNYLDGIKDAYETNPREAYARRAAEAVKHEEVESFIAEIATALGRRVEALDEVGPGERVMNLDGVRMQIRRKLEGQQVAEDHLEDGATLTEALEAGVQESLRDLDNNIADIAAQKGALIAVPKVAADRIQAVAKASLGGSMARIFFDGPTNLWRNGVLYWRPGYYVNNVFGNSVFLGLQGGRAGGVVRQLDKRYREAVRNAIGPQGLAEAEGGFHTTTAQRATHLGSAGETDIGRLVTAVKQTPSAQFLGNATDFGRKFNAYLEDAYRRESFVRAVEKQASKRGVKLAGTSFWRSRKRLEQIGKLGAHPGLARRAVDEMNDTMNNYRALAPWERKIVRRFLMPFWPFYKHASKTLLRMPYDHPAKARLLQEVAATDEEFLGDMAEYLPEWLRGAVPVGEGAEEGETRFLSTRGYNPFGQLPWENPVGQLHPALQAALEEGLGRDLFTGKPFSAPWAATPFGSDQAYRRNPETGEVEPVEVKPHDFALEYLLSMVPQYGTVRDITAGGARHDTGETIIDPATGEPRYPTDPMQEALAFLGAPTYDIDLGRERARTEAEREAAERLLQLTGQ